MRKLTKVALVAALTLIVLIAAVAAVYFCYTKDAVLDPAKLTDYSRSVTICARDGKELTSASLTAKKKSVKLEDLNENTINAFIASEDRTFYSHNGLNYKRMIKAAMINLGSRSFKEGASTISQQLIKNTHLTGDKTIKRKLIEIKLTRKLEKEYSKDEILEMYLNTIYFGHNCYGIESAAEFYFGVTADNLTTEQSATLVGLLTSPNNLSPFKNPKKCLARRNLVLKCMHDCGYLDEGEYKTTINLPLSAQRNKTSDAYSDYLSAVYDELERVLPEFYNLDGGCTVTTYLDEELQNYIESIETSTDAAFIITGSNGEVKAYCSDICGARRQPASTIKPLLVYAPAIEEKIVNPYTKILDEKINYGGYSPENHDKKYHGYISVSESLCQSYNVPAVKTLNALTIEKAEKYAEKMGIKLEDGEKNLSLALGGMSHGLSLAELCEKYRAFSGGGAYSGTRFIKCVTLKNGKTIYKSEEKKTPVFSQGTASLVNEMLIDCAKNGTAKRLSGLPFCVAAKTGTSGTEKGNTDAYCIAYTSADCIGVWLGNKNNNPVNVKSGTDCCLVAKEILSKLYSKQTPPPLDTQSGTAEVYIDRDDYNDDNKIRLADEIAPKLSKMRIKVLKNAVPTEKSTKFSSPTIQNPQIKVQNNNVCIVLCQTKYYAYIVKRQHNGQKITVYNGKWQNNITDEICKGNYTYTVTPYYSDGFKIYYGKTITLPSVNATANQSSPQEELPDIAKRNWYDE